MNAKLFLKFFKLLEKDAKVLYSGRKYRVYLDKDSKHTADNTKNYQYFRQNDLSVPEYLPPSSPDLNPIENVWGLVVKEIQKIYPQSLDDLKKYIRVIWKRIVTKELCQKLILSMPDRLKRGDSKRRQ